MAGRKLFLGASVALALLSLGWGWLADGDGEGPSYRTEVVTRGEIAEIVMGTGTLSPIRLVEVGTQVSGQVAKLHVQVNDHVKAGQLLAEIDPALLLAQIKQDRTSLETARAAYEQAKRDLERMRVLLAKDYVAKVDLERAQQALLGARNQYQAAQIVVERDEVNLRYAKITSPIEGVIIAKDVNEGQTLQSSFQAPTLFRVAGNLDEMKIDVAISEADIRKVTVGMLAVFSVNAFAARQFSGVVSNVNLSPMKQQGLMGSAVTYEVTVAVDNTERLLLQGMTAYVNIILSQHKDVLRVPLSALRFALPAKQISGLRRLFHTSSAQHVSSTTPGDGNGKTLYVLKDGVAVPIPVTIGATDEAYVAVSGDGIAEGEHVITGLRRPARKD